MGHNATDAAPARNNHASRHSLSALLFPSFIFCAKSENQEMGCQLARVEPFWGTCIWHPRFDLDFRQNLSSPFF
jgi:hypothetical protein